MSVHKFARGFQQLVPKVATNGGMGDCFHKICLSNLTKMRQGVVEPVAGNW